MLKTITIKKIDLILEVSTKGDALFSYYLIVYFVFEWVYRLKRTVVGNKYCIVHFRIHPFYSNETVSIFIIPE